MNHIFKKTMKTSLIISTILVAHNAAAQQIDLSASATNSTSPNVLSDQYTLSVDDHREFSLMMADRDVADLPYSEALDNFIEGHDLYTSMISSRQNECLKGIKSSCDTKNSELESLREKNYTELRKALDAYMRWTNLSATPSQNGPLRSLNYTPGEFDPVTVIRLSAINIGRQSSDLNIPVGGDYGDSDQVSGAFEQEHDGKFKTATESRDHAWRIANRRDFLTRYVKSLNNFFDRGNNALTYPNGQQNGVTSPPYKIKFIAGESRTVHNDDTVSHRCNTGKRFTSSLPLTEALVRRKINSYPEFASMNSSFCGDEHEAFDDAITTYQLPSSIVRENFGFKGDQVHSQTQDPLLSLLPHGGFIQGGAASSIGGNVPQYFLTDYWWRYAQFADIADNTVTENPDPGGLYHWMIGALDIHEVGHSLGLAHTSSGYTKRDGATHICNDYKTYSNIGDDTENIMGYGARFGLSACQLETIHTNLQTNLNSVVYKPCTVDPRYNTVIPANETAVWDAPFDLAGNLIVEPGATLTINHPVTLAADAVIQGNIIGMSNITKRAPCKEFSVCLKTANLSNYVVSENDEKTVQANRSVCGPWEKHKLVDFDGGKFEDGDIIYIQSHHGNYWSAQPDGEIYAEVPWRFEWETFEIEKVSGSPGNEILVGDSVGFHSYHGRWVVAENAGGNEIKANRRHLDSWETFVLE